MRMSRMSRMSIAVVLELNFDICKLRLPPNMKTGENCTSGLKLRLVGSHEGLKR